MNFRPLIVAGIVLGMGFGGFFDGIVLHQILQWHHMLTSAGYPADSVTGLQINTLADGLFHAGAWVLAGLGVILLARAARRRNVPVTGWPLFGSWLAGWGIFNLVEGVIDHHVLTIHHVHPGEALGWDLAFLAWGAAMLVAGVVIIRATASEGRGGETLVTRRVQS